MSYVYSRGSAGENTPISPPRSLAHRVAFIALPSLVFETAHGLLKILHLITIVVNGGIATSAAFFALRKDDRLRQSEESYRRLVKRSPDTMLSICAFAAGIVALTAAGARPPLRVVARCAQLRAHETSRLDRQ